MTGWTEIEIDEARDLFERGKSFSAIAHRLGKTRSAVGAKLHRLGARRNAATPVPIDWTASEARSVLAWARAGWTVRKIARRLKKTDSAVRNKLTRLGFEIPAPPQPAPPPARRSPPPRPVQARAPADRPDPWEAEACVPLADLPANGCRWPIGGGPLGTPRGFCGEPIERPVDACPYCPAHAAIAFVRAS